MSWSLSLARIEALSGQAPRQAPIDVLGHVEAELAQRDRHTDRPLARRPQGRDRLLIADIAETLHRRVPQAVAILFGDLLRWKIQFLPDLRPVVLDYRFTERALRLDAERGERTQCPRPHRGNAFREAFLQVLA